MEKNGKIKNIVLAVLLVAVLTLSIAYAVLSTQLTINSQATVSGSNNWKIVFKSATCAPTTGLSTTNGATVTTPFSGIDTGVLSNLAVKFTAPGDSITCNISVKNEGNIDAALDTNGFVIQSGSLSKAGDSGDITIVGDLTYTFENASSTDYSTASGTPTAGDKLAAGKTRNYVLTIAYPSTKTSLPSGDVTISGFSTTLNFIQD